MTNEQLELVTENLRLVRYVISKDYPSYIKDADIQQVGYLGLCKAATTWEKKGKFATYARKHIYNEIKWELARRKAYSCEVSLNTPVSKRDGGLTLEDVMTEEFNEN